MGNLLRDPALLVGLFRAALLVGIVFGLNLTDAQEAAVVGFVSLALTAVTVATTRPKPEVARALGTNKGV